MIKKIFCLLSIAYCLLAFPSCENNSSQKISEVKSPGQSLFETNCTNCHGADGKLCVLGAKDLSASSMTKEQMIEIIAHGKNTMAPFGNMLKKEEIGGVVDYVQTLKK